MYLVTSVINIVNVLSYEKMGGLGSVKAQSSWHSHTETSQNIEILHVVS